MQRLGGRVSNFALLSIQVLTTIAIRTLVCSTRSCVGLCVRPSNREDCGNGRCGMLTRKGKIVRRNTEVRLTRFGGSIVRQGLGYTHGRGGRRGGWQRTERIMKSRRIDRVVHGIYATILRADSDVVVKGHV